METNSDPSLFLDKKVGANILIFLIIICLFGPLPLKVNQTRELGSGELLNESSVFFGAIVVQGNSLLSTSSPFLAPNHLSIREIRPIRKIKVIVTAYSSNYWETDDTPYLTASGAAVRDGIVATNILPLGTKIRLPELYKDKVFIVEDRMSSKKNYHVDIWFPDYSQAIDFGVKNTYIEILQEA